MNLFFRTEEMDIRKTLESQSEPLKVVGKIVTTLNLIEQNVVIALTMFCSDPLHTDQEKALLFNDILWDHAVFTEFETKRQFLIKVIKWLARLATEEKKSFPEARYLELCSSIQQVQVIRNKLAHHYLTYSQ